MLDSFICASDERGTLKQPIPAPLFRKEFYLEKAVACASLYICGLGLYRVFINGKDITKGMFAPYISNTDDLVYVDEYELTNYLTCGDNVLCVILGNGLQNALGASIWELDTASFQSAPKLAFEITVEYTDHTQTVICSDESVMTAPSAIQFNDLWCGEYYDARLAFDWNGVGSQKNNHRWRFSQITGTPLGEQRISKALPINIQEERMPVEIIHTEDGFLYDFGVNGAGIFELKIKNTVPGQKVKLILGEYWDGQHFNNKKLLFVPEELGQVDYYTCRGGEVEIWRPQFVYHGFRYILVRGISKEQADDDLLTYLVVHADLKERGQFHCSDRVLEQIQEITRRSILSNFFFFPTDCPHREKHGWTDANQWAEAVMLNWAPEDSYIEWLANIRKAQNEQGMLPGIVPTGGWGMNLGGPYWDEVIVNLPWLIWKYRGDLTCFQENADTVLRYIYYLLSIRDERGLVSFGIGDWCPVGQLEPRDFKSPIVVTDTAICYDLCRKAAQLYLAIGQPQEAALADELAEQLYSAMRTHLVDWDTLTVEGDCQTSQAAFLYYRIFAESEWRQAANKLIEIVRRDQCFMDVGCIGGKVLFNVLSEAGEADLAYHMITRPEFPSYGNWLRRGATTLWEDFRTNESDVSSRNHPMWADISAWMYRWVAGLQINPNLTDCAEAVIRPGFISAVDHAQAYYDTPAGRIGVRWMQDGHTRSVCISVTGDCTAWLDLNTAGWEKVPIAIGGKLCHNTPKAFEINGIHYILSMTNGEETAWWN